MGSPLQRAMANFADPKAPCCLCGGTSGLVVSHIVPAFVYRWLKDTSATGYFRDLDDPNLRLQDGIKCHFLCSKCELSFSAYEGQFAESAFRPLNVNATQVVSHEEWLLRFATSLSWRVLRFLIDGDKQAPDLTEVARPIVAPAELRWRKYLLGEVSDPGEFEQHMMLLDYVHEVPNGMTISVDRLNAYLMRSVHVSLIFQEDAMLVYTKIGRFLFLGNIRKPIRKYWNNTRIPLKRGQVKIQDVGVPGSVLRQLFGTSTRLKSSSEALSDKQNSIIEGALFRDLERTARSGSFAAMEADAMLSGEIN